jgi:2-polyprenyl-3-methyl-5-hydroxy-6-metoxy-1,4-benzoquinol methylase
VLKNKTKKDKKIDIIRHFTSFEYNKMIEKSTMNKKSKFRNCPICNSKSSRLVAYATSNIPTSSSQIQITDKFFGLHGTLMQCEQCGFTYVAENKYISSVVNLYKNLKDEGYLLEEKERRLSFKNILNTIQNLQTRDKKELLDIGCSTGGLLVEAKKRGWLTHGIDPSSWACKCAKRLHGLKVHNARIEKFNFKNKRFQVVTLLDVLEHLENPKALLQKISNIVYKNSIVCIVTPDYGSFTAKILGKIWWGIRLSHISYFRYEDLKRILHDTNFQIIKRKNYIRYFSLYYILIRIFPKIEKYSVITKILKKITIPLFLFDTFELYLIKK